MTAGGGTRKPPGHQHCDPRPQPSWLCLPVPVGSGRKGLEKQMAPTGNEVHRTPRTSPWPSALNTLAPRFFDHNAGRMMGQIDLSSAGVEGNDGPMGPLQSWLGASALLPQARLAHCSPLQEGSVPKSHWDSGK